MRTGMRRFWERALPESVAGGWRVLLDGSPVRLPGGAPLLLATFRLAEAVAAEWQLAGGRPGGAMGYADVPLTRIAGTAQCRIAPDPEPMVLELARFGGADLLCYRAERPEALLRRQRERWQPWLDWAAEAFGARLAVTTGVMHVTQEPQALAALAQAVAAHSPSALAALGVAVPALGSLVLGLALAAGRLAAGEAHELACLDELFQAGLWGEDCEALARRRRIGEEVAVAGRFLELVGS
jgi:chaperone required for assembly of F1-ATPase